MELQLTSRKPNRLVTELMFYSGRPSKSLNPQWFSWVTLSCNTSELDMLDCDLLVLSLSLIHTN